MKIYLLFFLILIQGCALQNYLVPQTDWLIEIRLQAQLDLYYKQRQKLSNDIDVFLNSQKARVPDALKLLKSIDFDKALDAEEILNQALVLYKSTSMDFNLLLSQYLSILDSKQQKHFFNEQIKDNKKILKNLEVQNLKKLKERVEFFIGPLQQHQEPILSEYLPSWKKRSELRLERRKIFHAKLKEILAGPLTEQDKASKILAEFEQYISTSFSQIEDIVKLCRDLSLSFTSAQKAHLKEKQSMLIELLMKFSEVEF